MYDGEALLWTIAVFSQLFNAVVPCFAVLCPASDCSSSDLLRRSFLPPRAPSSVHSLEKVRTIWEAWLTPPLPTTVITAKGSSKHCVQYRPLGAGGDVLTRVTVQPLCPLETIVCVRVVVVLNRSLLRAFSFYAVPLYGLTFESVLSINNSVNIIHSLVIFARGVWLSVWAEKLV